MKRSKLVSWVMVAAVCSFLILSVSGVAQARMLMAPFAGEYGGFTQSEKGPVDADYTAIHQRSIDHAGNTAGTTYAQIIPAPVPGDTSVVCTSKGTATLLDDNVIQITGTQKCDYIETELEFTSICVGTASGPEGFTELYCTDTTEEYPGYEAISLTIMKRK